MICTPFICFLGWALLALVGAIVVASLLWWVWRIGGMSKLFEFYDEERRFNVVTRSRLIDRLNTTYDIVPSLTVTQQNHGERIRALESKDRTRILDNMELVNALRRDLNALQERVSAQESRRKRKSPR